MITIPITLTKIEHVKSFVNDITPFPYTMDISSDRYVVNAKSIMGLFSLDLAKPLALHVHVEDNEDLSDLIDALEPYAVKAKDEA